MNTMTLNVEAPQSMSARHAAGRTLIALKPELFRPGFSTWLDDNWGLYLAFEREANLVAATGRKHWGANTIIEYLRHETALRDHHSEFKFDDSWTSSIARLYAVLNPTHADLFEYRVRAGGVVRRAA